MNYERNTVTIDNSDCALESQFINNEIKWLYNENIKNRLKNENSMWANQLSFCI